jgi:hypothetical protein
MQFRKRGVVRLVRAFAFAAVVSVTALPTVAAATSGPFAALAGVWTGAGTISLQNGTKERLRCRVQYVVTQEGTNLQQALACSSDSYKFQVNAYVKIKDGSLSGNWTEVTKNVTGSISGKADGSGIFVSVHAGSAFSAKMTMVTSGNSQSVNIKPNGNDITDVSVKVSR